MTLKNMNSEQFLKTRGFLMHGKGAACLVYTTNLVIAVITCFCLVSSVEFLFSVLCESVLFSSKR